MAFSTDGSSREAIQAIQFEVWPDCKSGCNFCYLNGTPRITTDKQKKDNLLDVLNTLNDDTIMENYNAVGLIGGDFFQGQLKGVMNIWCDILNKLRILLSSEKIKEVWIASSLIDCIDGDLIGTLNILNRLDLKEGQRVTLCTSYDTIGRFKYNFEFDEATEQDIQEGFVEIGCTTLEEFKKKLQFNPDRANAWLDKINYIKDNFTNINIHVQIILTQDVINRITENPNYFDFLTDLGCVIDFRYPSITRADCPSATVIEDYRSLLLAKYDEFPANFFIEDRASFLHFLPIFANKYGLEKVKNLLHQPEMRSRRLKIYIDNVEIEDRWNDERDRYLDCGHLIDGLCYINDDKHCIYCDIEKFLETQEESV